MPGKIRVGKYVDIRGFLDSRPNSRMLEVTVKEKKKKDPSFKKATYNLNIIFCNSIYSTVHKSKQKNKNGYKTPMLQKVKC